MTRLLQPSPASAIERAPKAELHLHIEGSIEPETMFVLAERNGIDLPHASPAALAETFRFTDLASFGAAYQLGVSLLQTAQDYRDITYAYMRSAHDDHVVHAEIAVAPHNHLARGIALETVLEGVFAGLDDATRDFGMSAGAILGLQRQRGPQAAMDLLDRIAPWRDRFCALGLAGLELPHPPAPFRAAFDRVRDWGWKTVAHAGEEGPPAYVADTIDLLGVDRIDHGVRAWEDPALIARLVDSQIPLTVCPLSNVALRVFDRMEDHVVADMLRAGVCVTINSDDPPFFGGGINANYRAVVDALDLSLDEQFRVARNSLMAAFIADDLRRGYLADLDAAHARAKAEADA
jgi:adenosine deaminase